MYHGKRIGKRKAMKGGQEPRERKLGEQNSKKEGDNIGGQESIDKYEENRIVMKKEKKGGQEQTE